MWDDKCLKEKQTVNLFQFLGKSSFNMKAYIFKKIIDQKYIEDLLTN